MYLKEQTYILEIYNARSLSKAADKLHLTQPALSSFLANVEEELGIPLFTRTNRNLIPTKAGELYVRTARKMIRIQEQLQQELSPLLAAPSGTLRIGIQRIRTAHLSPLLTHYFAERYPNIKLVITRRSMRPLRKMLADDEVDLLLAFYIPYQFPSKEYSHYVIEKDRILLAVPEHSALPVIPAQENAQSSSPYPAIDIRTCSQYPFILQPLGTSMRYYADRLFKQHQMNPVKNIEDDSIEAALRMTGLGMGLSFTMESYVRHMSLPAGIRLCAIAGEPEEPVFALITKKQPDPPKYLRDLAAHIKTTF